MNSQVALLHYPSADSVFFERRALGNRYQFNVYQVHFPTSFRYKAPDSIEVTGQTPGSGSGLFSYKAIKKR